VGRRYRPPADGVEGFAVGLLSPPEIAVADTPAELRAEQLVHWWWVGASPCRQ